MDRAKPRIAAIVPCFRVRDHVLGVLDGLCPHVDAVFLVDDACPQGTAAHVRANGPAGLHILTHDRNGGVGAAVVTGYRAALAAGFDLLVKIDGDGQMDPANIPALLAPLHAGTADYAKGNRLSTHAHRHAMPTGRVLGNRIISVLARWMTGYRHLGDPMNGFTAVTAAVLARVQLDRVERRFFFETDLLCHLAQLGARVVDVPMPAHYGGEASNLHAADVLLTFPFKIMVRLLRRWCRRLPWRAR